MKHKLTTIKACASNAELLDGLALEGIEMDCRTALLTLLDQVDYTAGNCRPNEMVGAVLSKEVIALCRQAAQHPAPGLPIAFCEACQKHHEVNPSDG